MNISLLLDMAMASAGERVAISDGRRSLTTRELGVLAGRGASQLADGGHRSLVYLSTHGPTFGVALFAAGRAGVPVVPLNYRLPAADLRSLVANHPDSLVVADDPSVVAPAATVVEPGAWMAELESGGSHAPDGIEDPDLPAVLLYTSGTTSTPKAVILRHRHLVAYVISTVELGSAEPEEAALISVPPYHIAGVANLLTNLYAGRRLLVLDAFTPEGWLQRVRDDAVTHALVVPTMLARIVDHLGGRAAATPSLRWLAYGGARTPRPVLERALATFPNTAFVHAYGLTETASTIAVLGPEDHRRALGGTAEERRRLLSVGKVIPDVEVSIRDGEGHVLPPGEPGRVWLRGEQISGEYVGAGPVLDDEGWFDTRDRGLLDHGGYLYIEGRDDDTIIRGAENIAPAEIEDILISHAGVTDAVVVGLPDEEWGQRIAAVIVASDTPVSTDELRDWARQRLRRSRAPDVLEIWEDLPRTDNGKVIRPRVVERLLSSPEG